MVYLFEVISHYLLHWGFFYEEICRFLNDTEANSYKELCSRIPGLFPDTESRGEVYTHIYLLITREIIPR